MSDIAGSDSNIFLIIRQDIKKIADQTKAIAVTAENISTTTSAANDTVQKLDAAAARINALADQINLFQTNLSNNADLLDKIYKILNPIKL